MAEYQQPRSQSVDSEDFEDTNSQTITEEPSSDTTQATTMSTESNDAEDNDDNGLTELVSSGGEELLAFVDEIRQIDGLDHIQLDLPQVCTHLFYVDHMLSDKYTYSWWLWAIQAAGSPRCFKQLRNSPFP